MGQEDTYIVEEVIDKRIHKGKPEYFVKWEGFPSSQNTWEPKHHLNNCLDMIEEFERKQKQTLNGAPRARTMTSSPGPRFITPNTSLNTSNLNISSTKKKGRPASKGPKTPQSASRSKNLAGVTLNDCEEKASNGTSSGKKNEKHGFDRKLKAKEIVGAVENEDGVYCFLMRWENCQETDLVPAKEAHKRCPQLVIQFYEKRIAWKSKT